MIEYTVVANTSIEIQEIGFANKHVESVVYRSLVKPLMLIFFIGIHDIWD